MKTIEIYTLFLVEKDLATFYKKKKLKFDFSEHRFNLKPFFFSFFFFVLMSN